MLPSRFSEVEWRPWGVLFRNSFNASCYEANHAVILDTDCGIDDALSEIERHYNSRGIAPRIHSAGLFGEEERLIPALAARGYLVERAQDGTFLQTAPCPPPPEGFAFEQPKALTSEVAALLLTEGGEWSLGMAEYLLPHPDCAAYAVRAADGVLASYLLLARGYGCAYVQDVVTLSDYRRQGLCTGLLFAALADFRRDWPNLPLFLDAEAQNAVRIYRRAGFSAFEAPKGWCAAKKAP